MPLHVSSTPVLITRKSKLCYTASVIFTLSMWPSGAQVERVSSLNMCTGLPPTECDDTRCCIINVWPPDDEHIVLETCRRIANKNPTRCNSMQIFIYCKVTLHVSGVKAPIIRSTKNCNRSLRYSYFPPTWPDQATLEGSSCTSIMTCTGGCGYSF